MTISQLEVILLLCRLENRSRLAPADWLAALKALPRKEQQVLILYFVHGLSQPEIGEWMDVSRARANQLYLRAMNRLRKSGVENLMD
jgi:DNA-directed RNA polymerase specialized sigma subunit